MTSCILFFCHIAKHFSTPSEMFICTVRSVSRDICGALLLQLQKSFSSMRTDLPHVCCFCDCILAPPWHIFHCPSSQTWPITWWWMTSPSRSSCWLLAWPRPGSEARPHLLLSCGGATLSRHSPWWFLFSCFVVTDQRTHVTVTPAAVKQ